MCIPKIRLISCVPKNLELIEFHCAISELEHADRNDRIRTKRPSRRAESGAQNTYHSPHWRIEHMPQSTVTHRTHTTDHTGAQNTHHGPHGLRKKANELEWSPTASVRLLRT